MRSTMPLEKKYTMLRIYPGVELREELEALQKILRRNETGPTSLSEALRPALEDLVREYQSLIESELRKTKKIL